MRWRRKSAESCLLLALSAAVLTLSLLLLRDPTELLLGWLPGMAVDGDAQAVGLLYALLLLRG
jgi:hypothetical protein